MTKRKDQREYKFTYETHYFFDARLSMPSLERSHSKTEEGARRAAMAKVDFERYNKAVIVDVYTKAILHVYRRDPKTGDIRRVNHLWQKLADLEVRDEA